MLKAILFSLFLSCSIPLYSQDADVALINSHISKLANDCQIHAEQKPRLTISLAEEALRLIKDSPSNELEINILIQLSSAWKVVGDYKNALEYAGKSLHLAKRFGLKTEEASAEKLLGDIQEKLGNHAIALEFYFEALRKYEDLQDQESIHKLYNNIGIVYESLEDYTKALSYHQNALHTKNRLSRAIALSRLARVHLKMGEKEKALQFQNESMEMFRKLDESEHLAHSMVSMGEAYMSINEKSMAGYYLKEALKSFQDYGDPWGIAQTRSKLAEIMIAQEQFEEAIEALNSSLVIAQNLKAKHLIMNHNRLLYIAHKKMQKSLKALYYLEEFKQLNDELINAQTQTQVAELQSRYEIEKNSKAIHILERDKKIKQQEITLLKKGRELDWHFKTTLISLLFSCLIILVFGYVRYKNIQKSKSALSRYNKDLYNAYKSLKKINESKSELLGMAAHDLKNPLSGIISLTELLEINLNPKSDFTNEDRKETEEYLRTMKHSAEHMLILIEDWINNEALDSGKVNLEMTRINITELSAEVVKMNASQADAKNISIQFSSQEELQILADPLKLREVLDNLVSNAIKYSPTNKSIQVSLKNEQGQAVISILDEGPGFTKEDQEKAFQPFQRLSAQPTANEGSTGLGLSIAKKLTEIQEGSIEIHSETGNGAELILRFPLSKN